MAWEDIPGGGPKQTKMAVVRGMSMPTMMGRSVARKRTNRNAAADIDYRGDRLTPELLFKRRVMQHVSHQVQLGAIEELRYTIMLRRMGTVR